MEDDQEKQFDEHIEKRNQKSGASGSSAAPSSGDLKLLIKLGIPKMEQVADDNQIGFQGKDQTRACPACHKTFISGKALGGHMRVHVQAKKELKQVQRTIKLHKKSQQRKEESMDLTKRKSYTDSNESMAVGNERPTCSLCGKNFLSMKSLFGHMRCHPEREWRGIKPPSPPPPASNNSSTSSVSDEEEDSEEIDDHQIDYLTVTNLNSTIDLRESLCSWSVKAKRGRMALTGTPVGSVEEKEEEEEHDAVHELMRLAHGDSFKSSGLTHKQKVIDKLEATNSNSMTYKAEIEVSESKYRRFEISPTLYRRDHPVKKLRISEDKESTEVELSKGMIADHIGKGKAKLELMETGEKSMSMNCQLGDMVYIGMEYDQKNCSDNESDSKNIEQLMNYKYNESTNGNGKVTMNKNKKKRKKMKLADLEFVRDNAGAGACGDAVYQQLVIPITTTLRVKYRCSTCNKCFPTYQALGGHRSSHNKIKFNNSHSCGFEESSSAAADRDAGEDEFQPNCIVHVEEEAKQSEGAASSSKLVETTTTSTHQFKICSKTFLTSQALGAHKRLHWTALADETLSSQVVSPGDTTQTGRRILGFDLNEVPPIDDEDGMESEHGTGYGYASSSYNSVS